MNYKDTLLIPDTLFDMKANLAEKEPKIQAKWLKNKLVQQVYNKNKNNPQFIIHDGPPYSNGNLHVGHALNKILKDIIVRYQNQKGNYSPWICGWDTHGLPIETAVAKTGVNHKQISSSKFRNICREYALKQIKNQSEQFSRLGLLTDFNNKYITLNLEYELVQLNLLKIMVEKGLLYRSLKPIYWSCSSESALAAAEIEYDELYSPSIYVTFPIINKNNIFPDNTKIIIWTTTPWTIPMNQLLAVGKNIIYCIVKVNDNFYILAKDLVDNVANIISWKSYTIEREFLGEQLVGLETKHPLYDRISKVVLGYHVKTDSGTGIVHTASGFGEDDYEVAKENNVEIYAPMNDEGKYTKDINDDKLIDVFYEDANKMIGIRLKEAGHLLKLKFVKHKHPIDWRTKKPVIYRATLQWFVSIDKIKSKLIFEINQVNWNPDWSQKKMQDMIINRNDWCISRQRLWGVPIIAFYDKNNQTQISSELIEHVINLFKQEKTTNIWIEWPTDKLLPAKYQNKEWKKETNIMDVWFDSGISNLAVSELHNLNHPFSVYLEGTDQFRGWFNSSLICSTIAKDRAPYKIVLSHGFVNDEKGKKMSKSLGNIIDPLDIINKYGSDILRMWVASVDYRDDVKIGEDIIKQIAESYRKIRNTIRFLLANLSDFNSKTDLVNDLSEVDLYTLYLTKIFQEKLTQAYEEFNFNIIFNLINNFVITTLSKFYLDFIKDILYVEKVNSFRRRSVQTTLYYIYRTLIDALKPIIPHTVEEAHDFINYNNKKSSVYLEDNFTFNVSISKKLILKWEKVLKLRYDVNKELEIQRKQKIITKSLTCQLIINLKDNYKELKDIKDLYQIFIVSEIIFTDKVDGLNEHETSYLSVKEKTGFKCERCWIIVDQLSKNNEICQRCFDIIKNNVT